MRDAHPLAKRVYTRRLIPQVARRARLIITNSEYSKWEIVRHLGIPEHRIRVTPLAASPEFMPMPRCQAKNPYFLYIGNLEPRKNLERLIEAFARMPQKDYELLIVGNRWYHGDAPARKARALGLNGRVKFMGYVPRSDLPVLLSTATALVYPSLLEGFGLPIVEAMACGTPVITSDNSSMKEVAGDAAALVDPRNVRAITEALTRVVEDGALREKLSRKGLERAAQFSWEKTARLTLDAYREAVSGMGAAYVPVTVPSLGQLQAAIMKTVDYARLFQYPLHPDELYERLFDVKVDGPTFEAALRSMRYRPDPDLVAVRRERERISDRAIREVRPHLRTLASLPFVRMIAFSGSTAHRNMTSTEDVDLFLIIEDGKLWAMFLVAMVWAKVKGLRKLLCMNYLISNAALPLFERDPFTAQQAASLKPVYGKAVYDQFIAANPFVERLFPNFDPQRHRSAYPELEPCRWKPLFEALLRVGPVQILERFSRAVLGRYLSRKITPESDVQLDPRRLKLHLRSHKQTVLQKATFEPGRGLTASSRSSRE
jgi:hypothetical protein